MGILGQRNPSKPLKEFPIRRRSIQFRRGTPMSEPMFSDVVIHPRYPCRWPPELKWPNSNFSEFPEMWRFESEDLKKVLNLEISAKFLILRYVFFEIGMSNGIPWRYPFPKPMIGARPERVQIPNYLTSWGHKFYAMQDLITNLAVWSSRCTFTAIIKFANQSIVCC